MKLKEKREEKGIMAKALGKRVGISPDMMSRFENYKCLPVPTDMEKICRELECDVEDLYSRTEITYPRKKKKPKPEDRYRLTVDLPIEARDFLKKALRVCGYKDITYWVWRCYERLQKQYEIVTTKKGAASTSLPARGSDATANTGEG